MKYVFEGDVVLVSLEGHEVLVEVVMVFGDIFRGKNTLLGIDKWFDVDKAKDKKERT